MRIEVEKIMKKFGFLLLLTFFVLLAVGAYSKSYWYSYGGFVLVCVALIVDQRRYQPLSISPRAKPIVVLLLAVLSMVLLHFQSKGAI